MEVLPLQEAAAEGETEREEEREKRQKGKKEVKCNVIIIVLCDIVTCNCHMTIAMTLPYISLYLLHNLIIVTDLRDSCGGVGKCMYKLIF